MNITCYEITTSFRRSYWVYNEAILHTNPLINKQVALEQLLRVLSFSIEFKTSPGRLLIMGLMYTWKISISQHDREEGYMEMGAALGR